MGIESRFTGEQIAEFRQFEDSEIDRFLSTYWDYDNTKLLLTNLEEKNYEKVKSATKIGIRNGLDEYMSGKDVSVYLLDISNLEKFYYEFVTICNNIHETINKLCINLNGVPEFSDFVSHNFSAFIYQDSRNKFKNLYHKSE